MLDDEAPGRPRSAGVTPPAAAAAAARRALRRLARPGPATTADTDAPRPPPAAMLATIGVTAYHAGPDRPGAVLARPRPDPRRAHRPHARRRLPRRRRRRARRARRRAQLGGGAGDDRRQAAGARRGGRATAEAADPAPAELGPGRGRAAADARHRQPRLGRVLRRPGARARPDDARRDLDRDVGGAQLVLPAARPLRPAGGARDRPVLRLPGGQGALRAVLGAARPDDAARRGALVPGGRRPHRGGRHGAADAAGGDSRRAPLEPTGHETEALALLHAVGGFQAYRRACDGRRPSDRWSASCCTTAPTRARSPRRWRRCGGARDRRRPAALVAAGAAARAG